MEEKKKRKEKMQFLIYLFFKERIILKGMASAEICPRDN